MKFLQLTAGRQRGYWNRGSAQDFVWSSGLDISMLDSSQTYYVVKLKNFVLDSQFKDFTSFKNYYSFFSSSLGSKMPQYTHIIAVRGDEQMKLILSLPNVKDLDQHLISLYKNFKDEAQRSLLLQKINQHLNLLNNNSVSFFEDVASSLPHQSAFLKFWNTAKQVGNTTIPLNTNISGTISSFEKMLQPDIETAQKKVEEFNKSVDDLFNDLKSKLDHYPMLKALDNNLISNYNYYKAQKNSSHSSILAAEMVSNYITLVDNSFTEKA